MEELSYLIELQKHDSDLDELLSEAEAIDPQIQDAKQRLDALRTGLKSAKERLATNQMKKKKLEGEAEAQEKLVQKHNSELNSLKSNDAYKAMLSEIQGAKDAVKKIEDDILSVMEAIDSDDKDFKDREKKFKSDEATMQADIKAIEQKKAALLEQHAKKKEERDAYAKTVPAATLNHYDMVRAKRGGIAIVPMINNTCSGCHMSLTPHVVNDVRKANAMVVCENCTRILYIPKEAATVPVTTPPAV